VAILDADKEGFLRAWKRSLIRRLAGRRHVVAEPALRDNLHVTRMGQSLSKTSERRGSSKQTYKGTKRTESRPSPARQVGAAQLDPLPLLSSAAGFNDDNPGGGLTIGPCTDVPLDALPDVILELEDKMKSGGPRICEFEEAATCVTASRNCAEAGGRH